MPLDSHQLDEDGFHDEEECELCIEQKHSTGCNRKCGRCCEEMIIETSLRDAEREPKIKECPTIMGFTDELEGYLLNADASPCNFFDGETRRCTIYKTRPLVCRVFHCSKQPLSDGEDDV